MGDGVANGDGEELHGHADHGGLDGGGAMPNLFRGLDFLKVGAAGDHLFL